MAKKKKNSNISFPNVTRKEVKIKKIIKQYPKCDNINNLKIPNDTCTIITDFKVKNIENFHLKLNKYAQFSEELDRFVFDEQIEEFNFSNYEDIPKVDKKIVKQLNLNLYECLFELDYRLKIGAEESIYETSIKLHHIYGIPYIPSSAIKGVVRSYMIYKYFEKELNEYSDRYNEFEKDILFNDDDFKYYFGTPNKEGNIIFFDAFPVTKPTIKVDIMNPHYGDYYNDDKAPTDTSNPIPIEFLTVEDTTFQFFIASKETIDQSFINIFKEALQNQGIGSKTAIGYGYFAPLEIKEAKL